MPPLGTVPLLCGLHGKKQKQSTLSRSLRDKIDYLGIQYLIICRSKMLPQDFDLGMKGK